MMTRFPFPIAFLAASLVVPASAQVVPLQAGPYMTGHTPVYVGTGQSGPVIQDAGPAGGGGTGGTEMNWVSPVDPTGPYGTNLCDYDAPTTSSTGYHYLCFSAFSSTVGGGLISYGAVGAASTAPLYISANGVTTQIGAFTPMNPANNLSDVASIPASRANLGVLAIASNLSDVASAATSRTNLGLGTAAVQNIGASGATVPLLNSANTWSATQTISPAAGTGNVALATTQSGPVSGSSGSIIFNAQTISSEALNATSTTTPTTGWQYNYSFGGANFAGARYGQELTMTLTGASTVGADVAPFYTGYMSNVLINGVSSAPSSEQIDGFDAYVSLTNTTPINAMYGYESDVYTGPGTSLASRGGFSAVGLGYARGTTFDAAFAAAAHTTAAAWMDALLLTNYSGSAPLATTGCVICTDGSADTIATGMDLSSYTITGNFLKSPGSGFVVTGTGTTIINAAAGTKQEFQIWEGASNLYDIGKNTSGQFYMWDNARSVSFVFLSGGNLTLGESSKTTTLQGTVQLPPVAIASLPACASGTVGSIAFVNNGVASPTYHATVSTTGGATWQVSCTYNGTTYAWVY